MNIMFFPRFVALLTAIVFPASAWAQNWAAPPGAVRVQVNISIQRNINPSDSPDDQTKAMEVARRAIYDSVKAECGLLSAAFDSDCRLVNVNANSSIAERDNMTPMVNTNSNAGFELTPRRPEPHNEK
jgi:hypothetical protein